VITVSGCDRRTAALIRRTARATLTAERIRRGRLDVSVVRAAEMRRAHRRWRGSAALTDVLSFDLRDRPETGCVDGQVIICGDVAQREARRRRLDPRAELLLYVVHGCLHLAGFDDSSRAGFARMHRREDELLSRLGWGAVFARGSRGG
jgi:probable rRNA maturation factor